MEKFSGLVAFVRAAEHKSFTVAGKMLGISASAVGKSISRLEQRVGVRLFHRSTRQIRLTSEGLDFFLRCSRLLQQLKDAEDALASSRLSPHGRLRISLPAMGYRLISDLLPEFSRRYPDIELDLDFSDRMVDIIEEGFDAVIRTGDLPDSSLAAKRIASFRFLVCASPGYLATFGPIALDSNIGNHPAIGYKIHDTQKIQPWVFQDKGKTLALTPNITLTMNSMEAVLTACTNGLGMSYLPDYLVQEHIKRGTLVVLLSTLYQQGDFWVVWSPSQFLAPKTRAFIDFLTEVGLTGTLDVSEATLPRNHLKVAPCPA
jgi:DNA-binding transcriptional LysR family regulator